MVQKTNNKITRWDVAGNAAVWYLQDLQFNEEIIFDIPNLLNKPSAYDSIESN